MAFLSWFLNLLLKTFVKYPVCERLLNWNGRVPARFYFQIYRLMIRRGSLVNTVSRGHEEWLSY
jgi:hypothetical protein